MAGHSKWANIKHRKAAQDAKRGKAFTRLIRELVVASRQGGPSVEDNSRLRTAVDKALGANMTRDTIDRAISRGSGNSDSDNLDEITYEGYASSGIAVLIEAMTDNRNRTVAEVRHAFSKHGGNLGTDGSVAYLFEKKGFLIFSNDIEEDVIMDVALDSGAEDVTTHSDGLIEVTAAWEAFTGVGTGLSRHIAVWTDDAQARIGGLRFWCGFGLGCWVGGDLEGLDQLAFALVTTKVGFFLVFEFELDVA